MSALKGTVFKRIPPESGPGHLVAAPSWNLRALSVLAFAHGSSDFFSGMVPLLVFTVVTAQHRSALVQGLIGFLWYFTSSLVQPLFGLYSDRAGRWWFLPSAVALTVIGVSCAGLAPGLAVLSGLIVLGGLGSAIMHPEAGKYAAMLSGTRKSGGISIFQIGGAVGFALGPIAISRLIEARGAPGSVYAAVPGFVAVAILFVVMRRVDRSARVRHAAERHNGAAMHLTASERAVVALLVAATALRYLVSAAFMTFLPNAVAAHGGTIAQAGDLVTAFLAVGVVGLYAGGALGDRAGPFAVSIGSLALTAPALWLYGAFPGPIGITSLLLASVLISVQSAPGVAIVQRLLPQNLGMALGLMNGVAFGIGSAMVTLVGYAVGAWGALPALQAVSFVPLACAAVYVAVRFRR
ncbi:MAG: MFS transporter [Candidatus Eremiobacteraeota bacterium]|nr:MFS transporter [Candidatus Eremiobacteraeota bacterium]